MRSGPLGGGGTSPPRRPGKRWRIPLRQHRRPQGRRRPGRGRSRGRIPAADPSRARIQSGGVPATRRRLRCSRPRHSTVFSSEVLLEAEDRLLAAPAPPPARSCRSPRWSGSRRKPTGRGTLGDDQAEALAKIAVSGRIVDVLVGPAGARNPDNSHERAAPSLGAGARSRLRDRARALSRGCAGLDDLDIGAENTAKWWDTHERTGERSAKASS